MPVVYSPRAGFYTVFTTRLVQSTGERRNAAMDMVFLGVIILFFMASMSLLSFIAKL
jgi:hypothetical protein